MRKEPARNLRNSLLRQAMVLLPPKGGEHFRLIWRWCYGPAAPTARVERVVGVAKQQARSAIWWMPTDNDVKKPRRSQHVISSTGAGRVNRGAGWCGTCDDGRLGRWAPAFGRGRGLQVGEAAHMRPSGNR
jgi:hypothetical protein